MTAWQLVYCGRAWVLTVKALGASKVRMTGAKSRIGSKDMRSSSGLVAVRLTVTSATAWPSAGMRDTASAATLPVAPTRFSTVTGTPSAADRRGAARRRYTSPEVPAGKP
jgi:hypothetical protein